MESHDTINIDQAMRLVPAIARKLSDRLPAGISQDDLESAGNLALTLASRSFDASLGFSFTSYAARAIRNAMLAELAKQRRLNERRVPLEIQGDDGERSMMRPDVKAVDPADLAATRELVQSVQRKRSSLVLTQVRATSPAVAEIAQAAQRLRTAAFQSVSEQDMSDVMKTLVKRAKDGHVGSARLLLDYVGNGRGTAGASMQQAIIVPSSEVEDVG